MCKMDILMYKTGKTPEVEIWWGVRACKTLRPTGEPLRLWTVGWSFLVSGGGHLNEQDRHPNGQDIRFAAFGTVQNCATVEESSWAACVSAEMQCTLQTLAASF